MTPEQESIVKFFIETLGLKDILSFVTFFNDDVNKGLVRLYPWQKEMQVKLSKSYTSTSPLEQAIRAVNGSGKDKYIIAPLAGFKLCTSWRSRVIITSASAAQINTQTEPSILALCINVNRVVKEMLGIDDFIDIKQRHFQCPILGSEIILFATDEAGRAEGFHPWEVGSEMVLVMNEAKSIEDSIFTALTRCTGYNVWLEISSPGAAGGHFFESCTEGFFDAEVVTADKCTHISEKNLEKARRTFGESSEVYRSMKYAEFTSDKESTVFNGSTIDKNLKEPPKENKICYPLRAGIDMAAGGDEDVLSIWQGNSMLHEEAFRCSEPADATFTIIAILQNWNFKPEHSDNITIDDGGVGRGVSSLMHMQGWHVRRIQNQQSATQKREFGNKGAELWFNFKRLVEEGFLRLPQDKELLIKQLRERRYENKNGGKIYLEDKKVARAKGRKSPDRADAAVLANSTIGIIDELESRESGKIVTDEMAKYRAESRLANADAVQVSTPSGILRKFYANTYPSKWRSRKLIRLH